MNILITLIPEIKIDQKPGFTRLFSFLESKGHTVRLLVNPANRNLSPDSIIFSPVTSKRNFISGLFPFFRLGGSNIKWFLRLLVWKKNQTIQNALTYHFSVLSFFKKVIKRTQPDLICIWNPFCYQFGVLNDLSKKVGIKTLTIEWGPYQNTLYLDKTGSQTLTLFARSGLNQLKSRIGPVVRQAAKVANQYQQVSDNEIWKELKNLKIKRKILVLGTSEVDSGVYPNWHPDRKLVYPYFKNGYDCAEKTADIVAQEEVVIFKPHPSFNPFPVSRKVRDNFFIINIDPEILIDWADVVVASATKLELMVLGKQKILVLPGTGLLSQKEVAFEPTTFKGYADLFSRPMLSLIENMTVKRDIINQYLKSTLIDILSPDDTILEEIYTELISLQK